jgi:hypothetical protein
MSCFAFIPGMLNYIKRISAHQGNPMESINFNLQERLACPLNNGTNFPCDSCCKSRRDLQEKIHSAFVIHSRGEHVAKQAQSEQVVSRAFER